MEFKKALKEKIWVKVLIGGSSGSGKTWSALRLATGIASKSGGAGVAAIDTENGRIKYYADQFNFFDLQLRDYSPEKYIEAIDAAIDAGFKVLIIDSISHEWNYCNELNGKMAGSNTWANWRKITPRHDAFMEKILQSPLHIIATVRGKDEYTQDVKDGKTTIRKVGLGYKQRDNIEYDYTVTFNITDKDTHIADAMKDNTHIFEGKYDLLTEKHGKALYDWANSGEGEMPQFTKMEYTKGEVEKNIDDIEDVELLKEILEETFKQKVSDGFSKEKLYEDIVLKHFDKKNFRNIEDAEIARKIIRDLKGLEI